MTAPSHSLLRSTPLDYEGGGTIRALFAHSTALTMSSTTFLASPKTIIVLSM